MTWKLIENEILTTLIHQPSNVQQKPNVPSPLTSHTIQPLAFLAQLTGRLNPEEAADWLATGPQSAAISH